MHAVVLYYIREHSGLSKAGWNSSWLLLHRAEEAEHCLVQVAGKSVKNRVGWSGDVYHVDCDLCVSVRACVYVVTANAAAVKCPSFFQNGWQTAH